MKQTAKRDDKQALMALYNICFPGEEEYCRSFFDRMWKPERTLVYRDGARIVSMLQMFDLILTDGSKERSAYYIFGAATHPDYRGRSIMRELIARSEELNSHKDFAVLIAASESLKGFYGRLGYKEGFSCGKKVISSAQYSAEYEKFDFACSDFGEVESVLKKMNDIYLKNAGSEFFYRRSGEFLFDELCMREATVYMNDRNYAVAEFSDDGIVFAECMGNESFKLAEQVLFNSNFDEALAYFPGNDISLGMYKKIGCREDIKGYLNLLFN